MDCPKTKKEFKDMKKLSRVQLTKRGLGNWNGKIFLFPKEWAGKVPLGTMVVTILSEKETALTTKMSKDTDHRGGWLSYGILTDNPVSDK